MATNTKPPASRPATTDLRRHNTQLRAALAATQQQLALLRAEDGELLGHARATIAAARDGHPHPLSILIALLAERGQLPGTDQHPAQLLALGHRATQTS